MYTSCSAVDFVLLLSHTDWDNDWMCCCHTLLRRLFGSRLIVAEREHVTGSWRLTFVDSVVTLLRAHDLV
jgi:hypothetical protein